LIVTCPGCRTRYRVDVAALARPGGRTVRCAACGLSWHHPPAVFDDPHERSTIADPTRIEPGIEAPSRAEWLVPPAPPRRRRLWFTAGLALLAGLIVAVGAALYLYQ
jgi:predicted Zn finger-like uncharacterized protein